MTTDNDRIKQLFIKYLEESLTEEEERELRDWTDLKELYAARERTRGKIDAALQEQLPEEPAAPILPPARRLRWLYPAAASLLLLAGAAWYLYRHQPLTETNQHPMAMEKDIAPGGDRALLTLADGSHIDLALAQNGSLAAQGNSQIAKTGSGQLTYTPQSGTPATPPPGSPSSSAPTTSYNTLTTPRSGQFEIRLPDGTHVWMNNASSLRYPVSFTGAEREVELTGEAYFEIAPNPSNPFRVKVRGETITVLGTRFDILSYEEEGSVRTTLVEGKIKVADGKKERILKPGEQVAIDQQGNWQWEKGVDTTEIIDWKNGFFHFDHADLPAVMRQLARWYDVEVQYQGTIPPQQYQGEIRRDLTLKQVLDNLGGKDIHFHLEDRKLLVTP